MHIRTLLTVSAAAASVFLAAPAFAQSASVGGGNHNKVVNDLLNLYFQDNATRSYTSTNTLGFTSTKSVSVSKDNGSYNGNAMVSADQDLRAINSNHGMHELVSFDGSAGNRRGSAPAYQSGDNSVRGGAYAAFAGINNTAWNTGINNNTQAATNLAAQGTVNFGTP